ncbi:MAG: saccharopine dehydrogenase-like oxidoreductase [Candidatus Omnitrophica bacterium]|nr:saccharopine dehydrogenase-like oxidoreductase [Candidatus Omnitrophota bacterium]
MAARSLQEPIRIAMLGCGGLGKAAAQIIGMKRECRLVAICDSTGYALDPDGLDTETLAALTTDIASGYRRPARRSPLAARSAAAGVATASGLDIAAADDPLQELLERAELFDAVFVALPNLPNEFIPSVTQRFLRRSTGLVYVDVLKRTGAVAQMYALDDQVQRARSVYLTGCGATPGLLSAAAVLAAQSFITVESVEIWWGVGIANWAQHKATIREDIAHLPGYTVERAKAMTDAEVDALLEQTNGRLELHHMEHADDLLLERAGVVDRRAQVEVGGVMDTRHARKPVTTTMTLTGITFEGRRSSHRFVLGDETTMAANVIGPALGYLKRGAWLRDRGVHGVFGSTEVLPMVMR